MNEDNITVSGFTSDSISGELGQDTFLSGDIAEETLSGMFSDEELTGEAESASELSGELNIGGGDAITKEEIFEVIEEYFTENPVETVTDYPELSNKPKINDVELVDNKTAKDLGLQPSGNYAEKKDIPTKVSQLENDNKYLTEHQDLSGYALKSEIPKVPSWSMQETKPEYTASEVGADPFGSASTALAEAKKNTETVVSAHNVNDSSHNDLRLEIKAIADRLNALANSDDETLDEAKEIVAYIKANRELIEQITTSKVSVTDIINDLITNVSNKPLSAAQGVALKALYDSIPLWAKESTKPSYTHAEVGAEKSGTADARVSEHNASGTAHEDIRNTVAAIKVPTKVSELENDKNYLTEHQSLDEYSKTTDMLKLVYPVGAVYISTASTSPATLFGFGTWERIQDRFLLSAGSAYSAGATGGEATHELTIAEMPSHRHKIKAESNKPGTAFWALTDFHSDATQYNTFRDLDYLEHTGGNQPHNNMPPYLTVYMWQKNSIKI